MARIVLVFFLLSGAGFGSNALQLVPTNTVTSVPALPNVAPFNNICEFSIEGTIGDFIKPANNTNVGLFAIDSSFSASVYVNGTGDTEIRGQGFASEGPYIAKVNDPHFRYRFSRYMGSHGLNGYYLEVWRESTGTYFEHHVAATDNVTCYARNNWRFTVGSFYQPTQINAKYGAFRWKTVPPPLRTMPARYETTTTDVALKWEFEGNTTESIRGFAFSTLNGSVTYPESPTLAPVLIVAADEQVVSTGAPTQISTEVIINSDSLIGDMVIAWTSPSGDGTPTFTNGNTFNPTVTLPIFGEYTIRATVTDPLFGSAITKDLLFGGVVTDANGAVTCPAAWANACKIIGPMIRHGANPWTFADTTHKMLIDQVMRTYTAGKFWQPYWTTADTGTFAGTTGSTTLTATGVGDVQEKFCGVAGRTDPTFDSTVSTTGTSVVRTAGDVFTSRLVGASIKIRNVAGDAWDYATVTTVTDANNLTISWAATASTENRTGKEFVGDLTQTIVLWHPSADYADPGRISVSISACPSASTVTMLNYSLPEDCTGGKCAAMNYSHYRNNPIDATTNLHLSSWVYSAANANYYDGWILGGYTMYLRTGFARYKTFADTMAELYWRQPMIDRGYQNNLNKSNGTGTAEMRKLQLSGVMVYALMGHPEVWIGMNHLWDYIAWQYKNGGVGDGRETGMSIERMAVCAMFAEGYINNPYQLTDGTKTAKQHCQTWLTTRATQLQSARLSGSGMWGSIAGFYGTLGGTGYGSNTQVTLVNGSDIVNCAVGNCAFDNIAGANDPAKGNLMVSDGLRRIVWFFNTISPTSNADGDNAAYNYTRLSNTQIQLDRPYEGASRQAYWQDSSLAGIGNQMWMLGVQGMGMAVAADAAATFNPALAETYRGFVKDVATWLWINRNTYNNSPYIARLFFSCEPPNQSVPLDASVSCGHVTDLSGTGYFRVLWAEMQYVFTKAFEFSNYDATYKTMGDGMYQAMYGHPLYTSPYASDGYWSINITPGTGDAMVLDADGTLNSWFGANKWPGYYIGAGRGTSWPAVRNLTAASTPRRSVSGRVSCSGRCE